MVRIAAEGLRNDLLEPGLDFVDRLARREAGPVADAEDMGVDSEGLLAESGVEDDVGSLPADAGKFLEKFPGLRHLAAMLVDQRLGERDHVFRFGVEQTDGLDGVAQCIFAEINHVLRRFDALEQRAARDVHACVGRLRRKDDGDEQLIGVGRFQLGRRRRIRLGEPAEEFENLIALHNSSITSRIE